MYHKSSLFSPNIGPPPIYFVWKTIGDNVKKLYFSGMEKDLMQIHVVSDFWSKLISINWCFIGPVTYNEYLPSHLEKSIKVFNFYTWPDVLDSQ